MKNSVISPETNLVENGTNDEIIRREKDDDSPLSAARHYDLIVVNHNNKLDEAVAIIVEHLAD